MNIKAELENKRIDMDRLKEEHREQVSKLEKDYNDYYQNESNNYKERERELLREKANLEEEVNKYKNLYSNLMKKNIANEGAVADKMKMPIRTNSNDEGLSSTFTANMNRFKSINSNIFNNVNDIKFSELSLNFNQLEREQQDLKNMTKNMFSKSINNNKNFAQIEKELKEKMYMTGATMPSNSIAKEGGLGNIGYQTFNELKQPMRNNFFSENAENNRVDSNQNNQNQYTMQADNQHQSLDSKRIINLT